MKRRFFQIIKNFTWKQWLVVFAFVSVLGFTGFHIVRTVQHAMYWKEHRDQPIAEWMSVGYIAHSYHVPPPVLYEALELPPKPPDRRSLKKIAEAQDRSFEEIKALLEIAIKQERTKNPPPDTGGSNF